MSVQLRLLDKADKEILKLPRAVKGAIYDFQRKFRDDPDSNGLQFKQLAGNSRLYSARVTAEYRALLLQVSSTEYLLVAVKPRGDFARWQVFLHPLQRKIVERSYNGPARVSGGPGTGKTIVALHRVKHLVDRLPPGDGKDVLFTTFNKSLAADLRSRLLELAGREILERVDVVNIDSLASKVVTEAEPGARRHWMDDTRAVDLWRDLLLELGEERWDARFLHDEWSQVVLGQALSSRDEYFRARRAGRGKTLNRMQRAAVWQLIEQFTRRLTERNVWTFRQVAAHAALIEKERAPAEGHRYRHVVVDEAQDLSPAHWMLLRAMVAPGQDDMFLAGDTHQRIYDSYVSLGSLGIAIRGAQPG